MTQIDYESIGRMRAHFLFEADGALRDMLWWQVTDDGSLVISPRYKPAPTTAKIGLAGRKGRELTIPLSGAEVIPQKEHDRKVTYHSSGLIRAYGHRVWGHNLREATNLTKLGLFAFAHPFKFQTSKEKKGYLAVPGREGSSRTPFGDLNVVDGELQVGPTVSNFQVWPDRPLFGAVYACPLAVASTLTAGPVGIDEPDMSEHMTILRFPFTNLRGCQDLMFSFVFGYGRVAAWPPVSIFVFEKTSEGGRSPT